MTELTYVENITSTKCVECGDKLTDWETSGYCIICEPDEWDGE
jgi:hypothetical protein